MMLDLEFWIHFFFVSSDQLSHSVMSDSLQPHGLQHARLPCPSPTPGACSNSCPLYPPLRTPTPCLIPPRAGATVRRDLNPNSGASQAFPRLRRFGGRCPPGVTGAARSSWPGGGEGTDLATQGQKHPEVHGEPWASPPDVWPGSPVIAHTYSKTVTTSRNPSLRVLTLLA